MERLTGLDAGFLYMETPELHMHTLKVAVLDPAPGVTDFPLDWVTERIAERLHLLPPFTRRIVEVPGRLHHPVWIEDPDFDITRHVRLWPVDSPGGSVQRDEAIARIASRPLDRRRPLWELWLLHGLAEGQVGVLVKIHHAAADGVAAAQLLANVMSTVNTDSHTIAPERHPRRVDEIPSHRRLLTDAFADHLGQLARLPLLIVRTIRNLVAVFRWRHADHPDLPRPVIDTPRTSFNGALTSERSFATTSLPLADLKRVRRSFDVSLNDVVLAVVGGALRNYLTDRGELPTRPLVAGVPVSTDRPDDVVRLGGNRVSNLFTTLATDLADPLERLAVIHRVTAAAKIQQNLLGAEMMADWVAYTPPGPYAFAVRHYARLKLANALPPPLNVVVSNVPGPREPLFVSGATLRHIFSVGPVLEGIGLNITCWSYLDQLDVGLIACAAAIPEPILIADGLRASLRELLDLAERSGGFEPPDSTM